MNLPARGRSIAAVTVLALSALTAGPADAQDQPKSGGVLKLAMIGEPPTLDLHTTTATIVQQITWHIYDNLFGDGLRDLLDPKLSGDSVREPRGLQTQRAS